MAMELDNSFTVPVPPDQAWDVLLDVQRIAPCMPGATVDEVDGDVVNGRIKVKVGPVSLTYRGTAKFTERDSETHTMVVEASGKETRGAGTASATVRASLAPQASGNGTEVTMHTTMNVTGRPAQFGRGVMVEVGGKLVDQFAANLAQLIADQNAAGPDGSADAAAANGSADVAPPSGSASAAGSGADGSGVDAASADGASVDRASVDAATARSDGGPVASAAVPPAAQESSLNVVALVGPAILKRVIPVVAAAALALLGRRLWRLARRREKAERA
jgi:uncharacterized protein